MDAMASASADAREVDEAIRLGGDMVAAEIGIDESELENELQALVAEAEKEKEERERESEGQRINSLAEERMKVPEGIPGMRGALESPKDNGQEHTSSPQPTIIATT